MSLDNEISFLLRNIREFHKREKRKVHKYFQRGMSARKIEKTLEGFDLPFPDDFKAMYHVFNGVDSGDNISDWECTIILQFSWERLPFACELNRIMVERNSQKTFDEKGFFTILFGADIHYLSLDFGLVEGGEVPLSITQMLSEEKFIMFDNCLSMLRTINAAQDRGIFVFNEEKKIIYNKATFVKVVEEFNDRADYWDQFKLQ